MFCAHCHEALPIMPKGHIGGTGYATLRDTNERICYPCADTSERLAMRKDRKVFAYLSDDQRHVTTWTGGTLARVTWVSAPRHVGFGRRIYVNAIDATGQKWHGSGPADNGTHVRLTRTKR